LERDIEKRRKNKKNVPRTSTLDVRVGPSQVDQSLSHIDDEPSPIYDNAIGFSLGFYSKIGHTQCFQDKKTNSLTFPYIPIGTNNLSIII
jgi:hypothetical protein